MGKTVATHGRTDRGNIDIETYAEEAVIHWNGPPPAQSKGICIEALKAIYKDKWKTAFEHTQDRDHHALFSRKGQKRKAVFSSATAERLRRQKPRLAFLADGA